MSITFACAKCGAQHQVAADKAGVRARCNCGEVMVVPQADPLASTVTPMASPPATGNQGTLVQCGNCGRQHNAPATMAGQRAQCSCGAVLRIPSGGATPLGGTPLGELPAGGMAASGLGEFGFGAGSPTSPNLAANNSLDDGSLFDDLSAVQSAAPAAWQQPAQHSPFAGAQQLNVNELSDDEILAHYSQGTEWREAEAEANRYHDPEDGPFRFEAGILNTGVIGGAVAMLAAGVWFFAGLANGIIFFYPPVLFVIGLVAMFRGLIGE